MDNEFVLYIAPFSFPNGGAAARRIYGNCLSLKAAGYSVAVASGQIGEYKSSYNGIDIYSYNERKHENLPRYLKHLFYFNAGSKVIELLNGLERKPIAIILYSGYSPYLMKLRSWCTKHDVKFIFDAVEWYDPPSMFAKYFSPYYLNIELAMRLLLTRCDSLLVISSYLQNYYRNKVAEVILIPPTISCSDINYRNEEGITSPVTFAYSGTPGRKDSIDLIVKTIVKLYSSGLSVKLELVGITFEELFRYDLMNSLDEEILKLCVVCHGYVSHELSLDIVRSSDFSVIVRPDIRSVQAGFPTKFVESLAVGTPVVANLSSDIGKYIKDGFNGFVIDSINIDDISIALKRACETSLETRKNMRVNARNLACKSFDVQVFAKDFKRLLSVKI